MMLARGALCRLAAHVPKTTPHDQPQLARALARALVARNAANLGAVGVLSRRLYATTTRATKPTATVKKAVKKTAAAKKPAPTKKAAPAKKAAKKAVKKAVKKVAAKKPAPRKRDKTPEEKEKAHIADLRLKALKEPVTPNAISGANVYAAEQKKGPNKVPLGEAVASFKSLSPAEIEHYNHLANEQTAAKRAEYTAWVHSHTLDQIRIANNARVALRKKLAGTTKHPPKYTQKIQDDRRVKRPLNPYSAFLTERYKSGDFKGIVISEVGKLIGSEWKALSASEKKKYESTNTTAAA